jgi:hypothetical protein
MMQSGEPFVINLDDKGGKGTHWTAALLRDRTLFYADPFGTILSGYPPKELRVPSARKIVVNRVAWQRPETNLCGYYAYLFTKALKNAKKSWSAEDLEQALWQAIK